MQKVGALGSDLRGKKLAISLSPGWFLTPKPTWKGYEGTFSPITASEMVFGTTLDFELKGEIASRTLERPSTLEKSPLLEFTLTRLASGRWFDRAIFCAVWPVGKAQTAVMELQDHFAAFNHIRHKIKAAPQRNPKMLDWPKLIAGVEAMKTTDWARVSTLGPERANQAGFS